jgi:hypothetical protein
MRRWAPIQAAASAPKRLANTSIDTDLNSAEAEVLTEEERYDLIEYLKTP